uniref:glucan 1,3-beta-glucosidase n=1 Tax=Moniliophthora roreri TaxID=221103 RepID=A0A0W0FBP2_MONRR
MAYHNSDHLHDNNFIPLNQHVPPSPASPHYQQYQQYSPAAYDYSTTDLPEYASPQPRFAGHHIYQDGAYAASQQSIGQQSEYSSSVYALNDKQNFQSQPHEQYSFHDQDVPMSNLGSRDSQWIKDKKEATYASPRKKRKSIIICVIIVVVILLIAAALVVYFVVIKPKNSSSGGKHLAVSGGDGSQVVMEDGTSFIYKNPFGGRWYYDPNDPFNNNAQANSWTPPLNQSFRHGVDRVRGVNVGGWLMMEPFMQVISAASQAIQNRLTHLIRAPALFEKYQPDAVDEYHLHAAIRADSSKGGLEQIEEHYKTFITEKDFAEIAGAGLNYVRLPIPFWAIEVHPEEPYLGQVAWKYVLKAIGWARKYGLRINLDLHAVPGSQNGWNHSGRSGDVNFLAGPMGYVNAQRTLDYIRILTELVHQPQYRDVVTMFGIMNEPREPIIGKETLIYAEAYRIVRDITGVGEGVWISYHDAFMSRADWVDFLPGADRIILDSHPYLAFADGQSNAGWAARVNDVCKWGAEVNKSMADFGLTTAGEFSNAINDCGLWLNGVGLGTRYDGSWTPNPLPKVGDCSKWLDYTKFDGATKQELMQFAMASMDALQNFFFWTWKIGNSTATGMVESTAWSYQLGLELGWMPPDPRQADGACGNTAPFRGVIETGDGKVNQAAYPWPPATITGAGPLNRVPSYTPTGAVPTLSGGTLTIDGVKPTKTADVGNGWANPNDQAGMMVPVEGYAFFKQGITTPTPEQKRDILKRIQEIPGYEDYKLASLARWFTHARRLAREKKAPKTRKSSRKSVSETDPRFAVTIPVSSTEVESPEAFDAEYPNTALTTIAASPEPRFAIIISASPAAVESSEPFDAEPSTNTGPTISPEVADSLKRILYQSANPNPSPDLILSWANLLRLDYEVVADFLEAEQGKLNCTLWDGLEQKYNDDAEDLTNEVEVYDDEMESAPHRVLFTSQIQTMNDHFDSETLSDMWHPSVMEDLHDMPEPCGKMMEEFYQLGSSLEYGALDFIG